ISEILGQRVGVQIIEDADGEIHFYRPDFSNVKPSPNSSSKRQACVLWKQPDTNLKRKLNFSTDLILSLFAVRTGHAYIRWQERMLGESFERPSQPMEGPNRIPERHNAGCTLESTRRLEGNGANVAPVRSFGK